MLLYETSVLMYEMELAVATYCKSKAQPLTTFFYEMGDWEAESHHARSPI